MKKTFVPALIAVLAIGSAFATRTTLNQCPQDPGGTYSSSTISSACGTPTVDCCFVPSGSTLNGNTINNDVVFQGLQPL